jgi:hypothetical protein
LRSLVVSRGVGKKTRPDIQENIRRLLVALMIS